MARTRSAAASPHAALYDLPPPNAGRPGRGGLDHLLRPEGGTRPDPTGRNKAGVTAWAFVRDDSAAGATFLDPALLEERLDADDRLADAVAKVAAGLDGPIRPGSAAEARALALVGRHVDRVFEDEVLVAIVELWGEVRDLVVRYALAKYLERHRRESP